MDTQIANQLAQSGPLGIAVLALGYVVLRQYRDNKAETAGRLADQKENTKRMLELSGTVHAALDKMEKVISATIGRSQ